MGFVSEGWICNVCLARCKLVTHLQKAVNYPHSHVHRLLQQTKLEAHLHKPINENGSHVTSHLLALQISRSHILLNLGGGGGKKLG